MGMEQKIPPKLSQRFSKERNSFGIIIFGSLVRGMFDGRTDLNGMKI